jgi:hypothetical protein
MLENGTHPTVAEIAAAEKISGSYVGRILRLTLLAPDIVQAILGGRQPADLQLKDLLQRFPVEWRQQRAVILGCLTSRTCASNGASVHRSKAFSSSLPMACSGGHRAILRAHLQSIKLPEQPPATIE